MSDKLTIDARGLSCPTPAMMTTNAIRQAGAGVIEVVLDSATSRDNVERIARLAGWSIETNEDADGRCTVVMTK